MTDVSTFQALFHTFMMVWYFVLLFLGVYVVAAFMRQKRVLPSIAGLLLEILNYLVFQTIVRTSINDMFITDVGGLFRMFAVIYMVLMTGATALIIVSSNLWQRNHISINSIRDCFELMPSGICCYYPSGKVVMTNRLIRKIYSSMTGRKIVDGNIFYDTIVSGKYAGNWKYLDEGNSIIISSPDNLVYRFSRREIPQGKTVLYEVIASDITELYGKTTELMENNARMETANRNIREYSNTIMDVVREKEIMEAKSNIHDGMNIILMQSKQLFENSTPEQQKEILLRWKANALLLCKEAGKSPLAGFEKLKEITDALGIELVIGSPLPTENEEIIKAVGLAGTEAAVNAVKHAGATALNADVSEDGDKFTVTFSDNGESGKPFEGEGGGLSHIRGEIEKAGGTMAVGPENGFSLSVSFPYERNV